MVAIPPCPSLGMCQRLGSVALLAFAFACAHHFAVAADQPGTQPEGMLPDVAVEDFKPVEVSPPHGKPESPPSEGGAAEKVLVPLKYRSVEDSASPILRAASRKLTRHVQAPTSLKVPARLDGRLQCFTARLGERELLVLVDNSVPPRLCIDTDFDGNLAEERRAVGRPIPNGADGAAGRYRFGPVSYAVPGGQVPVLIEGSTKAGFDLVPAGYREGSFDQDGQTYRVALVDCDLDGRFDRTIPLTGNPLAGGVSDWIAIDQNGNGQFDLAPSGRWEIQPLTPVLAFKDTYYEAKVEADGSSISLLPIKPRMGLLDVGSPDSGLLVVGPNGILYLEGGGKWWLPEGQYRCVAIRLRHMDGKTKIIWDLASTGDTQVLRDFRINADQPLTVPVGNALTAKDSGLLVEETRLAAGALLADEANIEYKVLEGTSASAEEPPRELAVRTPMRSFIPPVRRRPPVMTYRRPGFG